MEQLQQLYRERAARKPQPHELDPQVAAEAFMLSLRSLPKAFTPYTIDKFTKCGLSAASHDIEHDSKALSTLELNMATAPDLLVLSVQSRGSYPGSERPDCGPWASCVPSADDFVLAGTLSSHQSKAV